MSERLFGAALSIFEMEPVRRYGSPEVVADVRTQVASRVDLEGSSLLRDMPVARAGDPARAREYHVERYWREVRPLKIPPVSQEMGVQLHQREGSRASEIVLIGTVHRARRPPIRATAARRRRDRHAISVARCPLINGSAES